VLWSSIFFTKCFRFIKQEDCFERGNNRTSQVPGLTLIAQVNCTLFWSWWLSSAGLSSPLCTAGSSAASENARLSISSYHCCAIPTW
jgi:hypothetical protein